MEKKVIGTTLSRHGNVINIYAVQNDRIDIGSLRPNTLMEVSYRLGKNQVDTFQSKYLEATAGYRSLIFEHPTKSEGRVIIVPTNNILSLNEVNNK
jgi:hypothetical protein